MSSLPDVDRPAPRDWLDGATGFVVESDAGRIGHVVEVKRGSDSGRPVALVVRAGRTGWRRLVVPVDDVAGVLPSSRRIVLNGGSAPALEEGPAPNPVR